MPFLTQAAFVQHYGQNDPSSDPEISAVIIDALLSDADLRNYFFRLRLHVGWAQIVWDRGFLLTPPEPIKTDQGLALPRWDAQEWLTSVAEDVPNIVLNHLTALKGHPVYFQRALVALRNLPIEQIEQGLPTIFSWLEEPAIGVWIALECLELLTILAKNKRYAAFDLLRRITKPLPPAKSEGWREVGSILPIDEHHAGIFWKALKPLQGFDSARTASVLDEQLRETLRLEGEANADPDYRSRSFWRNTIEDSDQDSFPEYKDVLLVGLRNAINDHVEANAGVATAKIEAYLIDPFEIFRRLGLYVLHEHPDKFLSLVKAQLLDPNNMDEVGIHHEYFMLLQRGYSFLLNEEKERLTRLILAGPTDQKQTEVAQWISNEDVKSGINRENYVSNYCKSWIRDRLSMIREHLEGEPKQRLEQLTSEIGMPDHAEYTHWTGGAFSITNVSPLTDDELRNKLPDELIAFLKAWRPTPDAQFGPERESRGALAHEAAEVIWGRLEQYQDSLIDIANIGPAYASSLISPAHVTDADPRTAWNLRLTICERLLADESIRTNMDFSIDEGGWLSFRRTSINMLKSAVEKDDSDLPEDFLPRVRDLLLVYIDDPDPTLESDRPTEGYFGHGDPLTVAINHNRSEALFALIQYARKFANRDPEKKEFGYYGIEAIVQEALSRKVRRQEDPSLAVHSVFGRELNLLFWLDRQWVENNIDEIFPPGNDEESTAFYVAAWDSFTLDGRIFKEVFDFLRPKYERAIDNVSHGYVTKSHLRPTEHLASHLLVEYFQGDYDIRSAEGQASLIAKFFNKTDSDSRGQAGFMLSRMTGQRKKELGRVWPRAQNLWRWRVDTASAAGHTDDFTKEMGGFSHLLTQAPDEETLVSLWPLLEGFLPYLGRSKHFDRIWHNVQEYLAKKVRTEPARTIQYYRLMHDRLSAPLMYYSDEARTIFEAAAEDTNSREDTLRLIDDIARTGNREFVPIFDKYAS